MVSRVRKTKERKKAAELKRASQMSSESKEKKLQKKRAYSRQVRLQESNTERQERIRRVRQNVHRRLSQETARVARRRIQMARRNVYRRIRKETATQRQRRIDRCKRRVLEAIEGETPQMKRRRLNESLVKVTDRIETETSKDSRRRLRGVRKRTQMKRAMLSPAEKRQSRSFDSWRKRRCRTNTGKRSASPGQAGMPFGTAAAKAFACCLKDLQFFECSNCNEKAPFLKLANDGVCQRCRRNPHKFSEKNDMDPGSVPAELAGLTPIEEMLIALILPVMTIYRLPYGQTGYRGHVINLPQSVHSLVTDLPRMPKDLDVIVVRRQGQAGSHKDFRVRRQKVLEALIWLKEHNIHYRDINISEENVAMLPEDDFLDFEGFDAVELEECKAIVDQLSEVEEAEDLTTASFMPMRVAALSEDRKVENVANEMLQTLNAKDIPPCIAWPSVDKDNPISEFETPGYIAMAFPTLFPTGKADLHGDRTERVFPYQYFHHLLLYKDGRFAQHPRFPYFALNSTMRWSALQTGRVFIKQNPTEGKLTINDIKEMPPAEKMALGKRMHHFGSNLRGGRPYWKARRAELMSMIDALGMPHVFFTLSAADSHWPELHALLPGNSSKSEALNKNPLIADWFFYFRVTEYLKTVLAADLHFNDYWLRFEYQHRGSPHVHGLAWLGDGVDVLEILGKKSGVEDNGLAMFIDGVMTAWNPNLDEHGNGSVVPPKDNPCAKSLFDVLHLTPEQQEEDYNDLVNAVMRHTSCRPGYCLRKDKTGKMNCRFDFPKELCSETKVEFVHDENDSSNVKLKYETRRNDPRVNHHNKIMLATHRANCDVQVILDWQKLLGYVVKYATKDEPRSLPFTEIYHSLLSDSAGFAPARHLVQRILMKTIEERDYSAQETMHLLLQLPLYMSSRKFVHLNTSGDREVDPKGVSDDIIKSSLIDLYTKRSAEMEEMSLYLVTQNYNCSKWSNGVTFKLRQKPAVVCVHPYTPSYPDHARHEEYLLQSLTLFKPFRQFSDLLGSYETAAEAWSRFSEITGVSADKCNNFRRKIELLPPVQNPNEQNNDDEQQTLEYDVDDWMQLCRMDPRFKVENRPSGDFDWTSSSADFDLDAAKKFTAEFLQELPPEDPEPAICIQDLNDTQMRAFHIITDTIGPIRMIVYGWAGTGKTFLIRCLKKHFGSRAKLLAPTGVAAFNIRGQTIHSAFRIPAQCGQAMCELTGGSLRSLQEDHKEVDVYLIDEVSMIGRTLLGKIDRRMRQCFPDKCEEVFGGKTVVFFGDFGQLNPVMDTPLFIADGKGKMSDAGRAAYMTIDKAVVLSKIERQSGDSSLRNLLLGLRNGKCTRDGYELLQSRFSDRVGSVERGKFQDSPRVFPTREAVSEYNVNKLISLQQPIAQIQSKHTGSNAGTRVSADDAGGLPRSLVLCVGAKVMLVKNISTEAGLYNGTFGTVHSVIYTSGGPPALPDCVVCVFPGYRGPSFDPNVDHSFPVFPAKTSFEVSGIVCTRENVPLQLAWAVTVHKEQGSMLTKAFVSLGTKEFSAGLSYVALSRVRKLEDLLLHPFPFQRLAKMTGTLRMLERMNEDHRIYVMDGQTEVPAELVEANEAWSNRKNGGKIGEVPKSARLKKGKTAEYGRKHHATSLTNRVSRIATVQSFDFKPLSHTSKVSICSRLDISPPPFSPCTDVAAHSVSIDNRPRVCRSHYRSVRGDGNCFYRCVSVAISSSEEHYGVIRREVARVVADHFEEVCHFAGERELNHLLEIGNEGTWAHEVDIFLAAHVLRTPFYIYRQNHGQWMKIDPTLLGLPLFDSVSHEAVFLDNAGGNHFNVVLNMD